MTTTRRTHPVVVALPQRWKVANWMRLKDEAALELFDSLLRSLGLSRLRLAKSVGKSHTTIANIRKFEPCRPDTAYDIAAVLGVPLDHLFVHRSSREPVQIASPTGRKVA
jgi:DNA-binding XRE family transcriptional regulator